MRLGTWLDIDGPLAWKNEDLLVQLYALYLHLDIAQERFEGEDSVNSVRAFEQLPEVQAFKQTAGTTKYTYLLELLVYLPEHLAHASVTTGAVEGVRKLALPVASRMLSRVLFLPQILLKLLISPFA